MLSLILAVLLESNAVARPAVTEIKSYQNFEYRNPSGVPAFTYASDGLVEFLGTPEGLYRARRILDTTSFDLLGFATQPIHNLYFDQGAFYVQPGYAAQVTSPERTLLRTLDQGASFQALDSSLLDCSSGPCEYLVGHDLDVPVFRTILAEQGGNFLATRDDGLTWNILYGVPVAGKPAAQICPLVFERIGQRVILGGECPLDNGWLTFGELTPDFSNWAVPPQPSVVSDLGNRNVHFIREDRSNGFIFAGVEGGLLRSSDGGRSFDWSIKYELNAERYPYIRHFVQPGQYPGLIIVGGFDKVDSSAYLAYSNDGGSTWKDVSALVPPPAPGNEGGIGMLTLDLNTRVLAIYRDGNTFKLAELTIADEPRGRRRAVRR